MRTTLFLKQADIILQVAAFLAPVIWGIAIDDWDYFLTSYFTVGAVQALSIIINAIALDKFLRKPGRRFCEIALIVMVALFSLYFLQPDWVLFYLLTLLFVSPVLAVWYFIVCFREMNFIKAYIHRDDYVKI